MSIGLDIGTKSVKIVELEKKSSGWKLRGSGVVAHPGKTPDKATTDNDLTSLSIAIKKLHKEANISSKEVSIALPETAVFTRTVRFPLLNDQEIASAVKWESEQYIPIPLNEAIVQHQIIERKKEAVKPEVLVLLTAASRKLIEKYVKVAQMAGLTVKAVETELLSIVRALAPIDKTVLIIDFGSMSTDIAIAKLGNLVFSRSIGTGGDAFTRAISQGLGIDYQQAEQYKKTYGLMEGKLEGKISAVLKPILQVVADEIKKAIHFYQSTEKGNVPTSVILSGGTSGLLNVSSVLTKSLGLEIQIANPFSTIEDSEEAAKILVNYGPLYSIAVGLAKRGS